MQISSVIQIDLKIENRVGTTTEYILWGNNPIKHIITSSWFTARIASGVLRPAYSGFWLICCSTLLCGLL